MERKEKEMAEKIFEAERLTKKYKTYALKQFDMEIKRGSIYGFIGKNGAGKTTLMRILTGRAVQTSGNISLFGEKDPKKLHIYIFLSQCFFRHCFCRLWQIHKRPYAKQCLRFPTLIL